MVIEPGVYRDKPTGAILLILGMLRIGPDENEPNFLDMVDLVVLNSGDVPHEWEIAGARVKCMEEIFDGSYRDENGKIVRCTCLERVV